MKTNCLNCGTENPKHGMKTCSRLCADTIKKKKSREIRKCAFCNNDFEIRKKETKQLCSETCRKKWQSLPENIESRINSSKKSIKEKYGVDNVFQLNEVKEKSKKTKLEKYGDENYNNPLQQIKTMKEKYGENAFKNRSKKAIETIKKLYGVDHPLQHSFFLEKQRKTVLEKFGVDNVSQFDEVKKKRINTIQEKFGVDNVSKSEDIKKQKKETSFKRFGVEHHLKDGKLFLKHLKKQYKVENYKETDIYYQGSYERYFLELIDDLGFLDEVSNGNSYNYIYNKKEHMYHVDFCFRNYQIEIKSSWTYNNDGKNLELQNINDSKWKYARNQGANMVILINKDKIKEFISSLRK